MKLEHSGMQSDNNRYFGEANRYNKMATKVRRKKSPELMSATEMDKALADIK